MLENEAKLASILRTHCDTTAYASPRIDIEWFLLALLIVISAVELCLIVLSITEPCWQYYTLLALVAQYSMYLTFHMLHEYTHRTIKSGPLLRELYYVACFFHGSFGIAGHIPYYSMGHLQHHRHNCSSSLYDFIREPCWHGKDADILFFGLTEKNPFFSDSVPLQLLNVLKYVLYCPPMMVAANTILTLGNVFKLGLTK